MKKMYKKLLALTMIATVVLMFSIVPAIATENPPTEPTEPPTAPTAWTSTSSAAGRTLQTITARNIEEPNVTVTAYQIVKGTYKDDKFTGYVKCAGLASVSGIESFNFLSPSSDCITKIANYIEGHPTAFDSVQMAGSGSTYTATVEAGEYIILVRKAPNYTGIVTYAYNPAVVAVNVRDANLGSDPPSSTGGTVDMRSQFSFGSTAYMKSSYSRIEKQIVIDANTKSQNNRASFGDRVNFEVSSDIPSYSEDYASPLIYRIIDDLYLDHTAAPPFLGVSGLTVKVGTKTNGVFTGSEVPQITGEGAEAVTNYEVKYYKKNEITTGEQIVRTQDPSEAVYYEIEFSDAFIRANGTKYVEVTYSSTLTTNAKLAFQDYSSNFASNNTKASLQYSNNPADKNSYNSLEWGGEQYTYTKTFGIDAVGNGVQTYELNKVSQALGANDSYKSNTTNGISTMKSDYALAGATFTIYSDRAMNDVIELAGTATTPPNGTSISDENGHIEFRGLAPGTYYIKETAAPSDYTLNENNYKIVISEGQYGSVYTITTYLMGETDTQIGSATYTSSYDWHTGISQITPTVTPAEIVNTTLATLPTTGGVGTIIISVVAGLGMAVFLTIFVISKKKKAKKIDTQTID